MAKLQSDQVASDFFGEDVDISSSSYPAGRIAIARDNARLFVGNVNNYYSENPRQDAFSIEDLSITDTTMMNPLSFTTSVLAAVTQTADTLRSCQRHAARLRIADLSIASLHTECSTIRLRLNQIQSLMLRGGEKQLEDRFEDYVLNEYDDLLQACCLPFSILNRHLESLGITQVKEMDRVTMRGKLHDMWAYSQMEMICHTIGSLARAIGILSSAFQSDTATKASAIMRSPESKRVLASISNDAVSLHDSFLAAHGTQEESIRDSVIGDEVFEFDNVLKNTDLYRKAFVRQTLRSQTTKLEIATKVAATSPSVPGKPIELPVLIESGLTVIPSNSNSSPKGPGNPALGERGPKAETKLDSAASDRKSTLVPIQPTNRIKILPNLTRDQAIFQQVKAGQDERRNSTESRTSNDSIESRASKASIKSRTTNDTILPDDSVRVSPLIEEISAASSSSQRPGGASSFYYGSPNPARLKNVHLPIAHQSSVWPISTLTPPGVSPDGRMLNSSRNQEPAASEIAVAGSTYDDPSSSANSALLKSSSLPLLLQVLERRTVKPYSLFEFYLYMRDIQQSVDYLDFWLDVQQHLSLCRHYVRELRTELLVAEPDPINYAKNDDEDSNVGVDKTVARSDIRASAQKIFYTFILPNGEREIIIPDAMLNSIIRQIEEEGRDDPEVFEEAKNYVFDAMERDAFLGFLNLGRPVFRMFRKSKSLGGLVNKMALRRGHMTVDQPPKRSGIVLYPDFKG